MPMYDYVCSGCGKESEKIVRMDDRAFQRCEECGESLEQVYRPQNKYVPFHNYFDQGLGVEVTGRMHKQRVLRDLKADERPRPRPGDVSARKDRIRDTKREEAHRR